MVKSTEICGHNSEWNHTVTVIYINIHIENKSHRNSHDNVTNSQNTLRNGTIFTKRSRCLIIMLMLLILFPDITDIWIITCFDNCCLLVNFGSLTYSPRQFQMRSLISSYILAQMFFSTTRMNIFCCPNKILNNWMLPIVSNEIWFHSQVAVVYYCNLTMKLSSSFNHGDCPCFDTFSVVQLQSWRKSKWHDVQIDSHLGKSQKMHPIQHVAQSNLIAHKAR